MKNTKEKSAKTTSNEPTSNPLNTLHKAIQEEKQAWTQESLSASGELLALKADLERKYAEIQLLKENLILERNQKTSELDYLEQKEKEMNDDGLNEEIEKEIAEKEKNNEKLSKEAEALEQEVSLVIYNLIIDKINRSIFNSI